MNVEKCHKSCYKTVYSVAEIHLLCRDRFISTRSQNTFCPNVEQTQSSIVNRVVQIPTDYIEILPPHHKVESPKRELSSKALHLTRGFFAISSGATIMQVENRCSNIVPKVEWIFMPRNYGAF